MSKFTYRTRSLIVFAGAVIAVLALANVAVADEGQAEPGAIGQATVEVLPVRGDDGGTAAEEPVLEPGDNGTVAVVHDLPAAITPAPNPDEEPPILETIDGSETVVNVNSHLGVPGGVEPTAGVVDEPVVSPSGTESIGVAESTGWTVSGWVGVAAILAGVGVTLLGVKYLLNRRHLDEAMAN